MHGSHAVLHSCDGSIQTLQNAVRHACHQLASFLFAPHDRHTRLRVALFRLPSRIALSTCFALHRLQCAPVFLNDRWNLNELRQALQVFPPSVFITTRHQYQQLSTLLAALRDAPSVLLLSDDASAFFSPSNLQIHPHTISSTTCAVFFTSGTSAKPKPVPLTFRNIYVQSRFKQFALRLTPTSVYLHLAPLYHLSGFSSSHAATLSHAHHVFPPSSLHVSDASHAKTLLALVHRSGTTHLVAVPATLQLLVDVPNDNTLPHVRVILYGGARAQPQLISALSRLCPNAALLGAYGMSETASTILLQKHPHPAFLAPHFAVRVVNVETGRSCEPGERGELLVRGSAVFNGYPNVSKSAYFRDGFFRTGDIVVENSDGSFKVFGRVAESIRSAGETVWPAEVETTLLAHPAVKEAAVVGVPHRILGEAVVAAVVLLVEENVSRVVNTLMGVCRKSLALYKCPKQIFVAGRLPRNPNGKLMRAEVRRLFIVDKPPARL
ncbi:unnamed protein product [Agarophyton chilense]